MSMRYSTIFVIARDQKSGMIFLGGLGGMRVGQMWFKEEKRHSGYEGYGTAPEQVCPPESIDAHGENRCQDLACRRCHREP